MKRAGEKLSKKALVWLSRSLKREIESSINARIFVWPTRLLLPCAPPPTNPERKRCETIHAIKKKK